MIFFVVSLLSLLLPHMCAPLASGFHSDFLRPTTSETHQAVALAIAAYEVEALMGSGNSNDLSQFLVLLLLHHFDALYRPSSYFRLADRDRLVFFVFKGHDMHVPFTAGWQTTDVNPLVIEKLEGSYVYEINGKRYLDSLARLFCTALGKHSLLGFLAGGSEPRLVDAATRQLKTLPFYYSFWNQITKPALDLAEEILDMFITGKMAKVFFTKCGSEANDSQV
ncbi:hypothetical protein OROMI_014532 [Orobanche minor]